MSSIKNLDHIVLAAKNVDMACKAFYNLTGINPTFGGSHVNRGTKNYLINIGGNKYLELIGLDDMQNVEEIVKTKGKKAISFGVYDMTPTESKVSTFACVTPNLVGTANSSPWVGKPFSMSRKTPEGDTLNWSLAVQHNNNPEKYSSIYPFFIDWTEVYKQDLHPAKTSAAGCRLITLIVEAQDPTKYNEGLYYSGVGEAIFANNTVSVCKSDNERDRLIMVLDTPNGVISISDNLLHSVDSNL